MSYDLEEGYVNLDNRKLVLIWEDILREHGGEETVNIYKNKYSNYSIENFLELAIYFLS
ncbi:hypothetical protein ACIQ57_23765 [Lysinibacillus xylanilyticus]|uniref:hypothetical protein n=1 Tax=Lysinibacillus xylanilyticus TaxID=582475 RepID=UPI00381F7E46